MIYIYIYVIFNKYYQTNKEKLRKKVHDRYQNLSEEEKEKGQKMIKISLKKINLPSNFLNFTFLNFV